MKLGVIIVLVSVLTLSSAQFDFGRFFRFGNQRRPQQNFRPQQQNFRPQQQNFRPQQQNFQPQQQNFQPQQQNSGGLYYSWEDPSVGRNAKFSWGQANNACRNRGQKLVSLDSPQKNNLVVSKIGRDGIDYIWTSGQRRGNGFVWGNGQPVRNINWSSTGGAGRPQPDNREGDENCLAILNKFYPGDGITWHDVSCHHTKPYVCE